MVAAMYPGMVFVIDVSDSGGYRGQTHASSRDHDDDAQAEE